MSAKKVILAGGGTGGHIYPALAIASGLKKIYPDIQIIFIGTNRGLEKDLVPKAGYSLKTIRVKGFRRKPSLDTLSTIIQMFLGGLDSLRILKEEKPDLVIGTGGYVSGPVIFFASLLHIPAIIHEQNVNPGITNRLLSRFVKEIAISFPETAKYLPKSKTVLTGNPVRPEIEDGDREKALKDFGLDAKKPVVLSFGGSQGAKRLNEAMADVIFEIKGNPSFQLIHVTGEKQYTYFMNLLENKGIDLRYSGHIIIKPYIYEMQKAYAAADLVISRAGAISISEITLCGKPAILIPLPTSAGRHQDYNAGILKEKGAAKVLNDKELSGEILYDAIIKIITDKRKLKDMSIASSALGKPEALESILAMIQKTIG
jgi:UDP-N-acetylglucosamine--N-acetylmuramyl-(pentapeptide) pyrophosphoryl-undecaprenol N-acetylglucosamine transferase